MVQRKPSRRLRPYRALGMRIAALRWAKRYKQRELAELVGISEGYPGSIELGRVRPDPKILREIARVLGADYRELAALAGYIDAEPEEEAAGMLRRIARFPARILAELEVIGAALVLRYTEEEARKLQEQEHQQRAHEQRDQDDQEEDPDAPAVQLG